jgi:hypothetical protein
MVSILAGGGLLPVEIAREIARTGGHPRIVALTGIANADFSGLDVETVALGQVGHMLAALRRHGTRDMVIAGHVRRPDLTQLRIDAGFIRHLPTILGLLKGGDDHVMRRIANFFEARGLNVVGAHEVAPGLLTPEGVIAGSPADADIEAMETGERAIARLGPYDIGQAVVIEDGELAAIEGAEGTDGLLARLPPTSRRRVLVKAAKRGQDLRVDLPTVGPDTLRRAAAAGIAAIGLDAGRSLIVAGLETRSIAAQTGMALVGRRVPEAVCNLPPDDPGADGLAIDVALADGHAAPAIHRDNARLGLALLEELGTFARPRAALIARNHVLAVNVAEPMAAFLARTRRLGQWGDGRRLRRNLTLVLTPGAVQDLDDIPPLSDEPIAAIACDPRHVSPAARAALAASICASNILLLERL